MTKIVEITKEEGFTCGVGPVNQTFEKGAVVEGDVAKAALLHKAGKEVKAAKMAKDVAPENKKDTTKVENK